MSENTKPMFKNTTKQIFLVGGAVRDELLGIKPKDEDFVVVGSNPSEMLASGFSQVGNGFPVFIHPENGNEYALARQERKTAGGYNGFSFDLSETITIEEDLERRDLTINAIAKNTESNEIIDPFNGRDDIDNRIIRHVSNAYCEDPVRVLRTARFLARYHHLGFTIADETLQIMREMSASGELENLTPERIWKEFECALSTPKPSIFFNCLHDIGALAVVMPELDLLWGTPQPIHNHPEICTGLHSMLSLDICASITDDLPTRFATLVHDLGKGVTQQSSLPHHYGHENAGVPIVEIVCERLKTPKKVRDLAVVFCKYHTHIHRINEMKASRILTLSRALCSKRKPERLKQFAIAAESDCRGRKGLENSEYPQSNTLLSCMKAISQVDLSKFDFSSNKGRCHAIDAQLSAIRTVTGRK